MGSEVKKDCSQCANSRPVISENGFHPVCGFTSKVAMDCLTGKKDRFEHKWDWRYKLDKQE